MIFLFSAYAPIANQTSLTFNMLTVRTNISNSSQLWWVMSRFMLGHDLCRATKCFEKPASCLPGYNPGTSDGVSYQDVCSFYETRPELIPFGLSSCVDKPSCTCQVDNACAKNGDIFLYLNRSQPEAEMYLDELMKALATFDATCGGLPYFGAPTLQMSYGKKCLSDTDCIPPLSPGAPGLRQCTPGVDCFCCANVSLVCSSDDDCSDFGVFRCPPSLLVCAQPHSCSSDLLTSRYLSFCLTAINSMCGCQRSNPTDREAALIEPCGDGPGERPCFCCNDMTISCTSNAHCGVEAVGKEVRDCTKMSPCF